MPQVIKYRVILRFLEKNTSTALQLVLNNINKKNKQIKCLQKKLFFLVCLHNFVECWGIILEKPNICNLIKNNLKSKILYKIVHQKLLVGKLKDSSMGDLNYSYYLASWVYPMTVVKFVRAPILLCTQINPINWALFKEGHILIDQLKTISNGLKRGIRMPKHLYLHCVCKIWRKIPTTVLYLRA